MKRRWLPFSMVIAMAVGLVVLLGYFFPDFHTLGVLREEFVSWAIIVAAVALLVGVLNLLLVHIQKFTEKPSGNLYSLVLILAFVLAFLPAFLLGPYSSEALLIFRSVQVPIESSLMALLAVSLAYASARLLHRRTNILSFVFVGVALLILVGTGFDVPFVSDILRPWIAQVPAAAGARGILLGVALGSVATSLRILIGLDRPYSG